MLGIDHIDSLNYMVQLMESIMLVLCEAGITPENIAAVARALINNPDWKPTHGLGSPTQQTTFHLFAYYLRTLGTLKSLAGRLGVEVQKAADFDKFTSILAPLVLKTDSPSSPLSASLIAAAGPAAATLQSYLFVQGRALCITQ
jgi:hypothetical protein